MMHRRVAQILRKFEGAVYILYQIENYENLRYLGEHRSFKRLCIKYPNYVYHKVLKFRLFLIHGRFAQILRKF